MDATYFDIQYKGVMNYSHGYRHRVPEKETRYVDYRDVLREVSKYPPSERKKMLPIIRKAMRNGTWKGAEV